MAFDGSSHTATGTATGVGGADLSAGLDLSGTTHTNAGTYASDAWTFAGGANYNDANGTVTDAIGPAVSTTVVTFEAGPYAYRGTPFTATATVTGVGGLNESLTVVYSGDCTNVTVVNGCTASAAFLGDANHAVSTDSKSITIAKANPTVVVTGYSGVYDGAAHGATGTATGVLSEALVGLALGSSFTDVPGGTANWTFTDVTGNYNDASGSAAIVIAKANPTVVVTGYSGVYDGAAHGATGTATGVLSEALAGLALGSSFTDVPGGTASWTFTDVTGNYNDASGSAAIVIAKANPTVVVTGYSGVYDGAAHGATGTATGVLSEALAGLALGSSFTDVPGGTASWTFTDVTGNYNDASGTAAIVIAKANPTVVVTGYSGVYDGAAHGATGTATGVLSEALAGLALGSSFTDVPGGTASWTFTDVTGNYNDASGSAAIVIAKANPTVVVTGYSGVYDGAAHGATGTATGVLSEALAGLALGSSFTDVPGGTANWTFTDVTGNYNDASGSAAIVIAKANPTVVVTGYSGVYDGAAHGATGTATGVLSEALAGLALGSSFTDVPGGTANWTFTDVTGNYNDASGSAAIVIAKANPTVVVTGYSGVYDGAAHGATGTATGVLSEALAGLALGSSFTDVPGGTANWTFTDVTGNYNNASGSAAIVISKADATIAGTIVGSGYSGVYDGLPHGATGTATGVLSEPLAGLDFGLSFTDVPGGTANWTFTDVTGNYNNDSGSIAINIAPATSTTAVSCPASVVYNGAAQTPCAVAVTGANLSLTPAASYTNNTNVGTAGASYIYGGDLNHFGSSDAKTFAITAGPAAALAFVGQPTNALPGAVISPNVTVQVVDAYGNPTTVTLPASVTLTLNGLPGTLSGTPAQPINGTGLATFDDLSVSDIGTYTLTAASGLLTGPPSNSFDIVPSTAGLLADVAASDADFNHIDGFDVLFAGASSSAKKLAATSPGTFHYQLDLRNETGVTIHKRGRELPKIIRNGVSISDHNGASSVVIITVPSLPMSTGLASVPGLATTVGSPKWAQLPENSAFKADGSHSVRVVPGDGGDWDWYGHRDDHSDDADVTIWWAATAPAGNCLAATGVPWVLGQPTNNAFVKCVKVEGLEIPKHHAAHVQVNFEFALKGTDGWAANAATAFRAGFPFKSQTQVKLDADFPIASLADKTYVGNDVAGLSGAGEQITAIGGFVFDQNGMGIGANNIADNLLNATIRVYNTAPSAANRCTATGLVAETTTDADGFYFLWKTGGDQSLVSAPNLPSGVRYYVMVCDVTGVPSPYWPARSIGHTLANKEFEEENFYVSNPTHLGFSVQPITNRLGRTMYPVQVALLDQWNNLVADSTLQVTLSIDTGQGGTLSGTKVRTMVNGYATFSDLKISGAGTAGTYTLHAVDTSPSGLGHPFTDAYSLAFTMTN